LSDIRDELENAIKNGMISMGPNVEKLEKNVMEFLNVSYSVCLDSATSALMLVLRNLNGDILVPSYTFHATLAACWWNRLNPIYVDIDPETLTMDPIDAERKITANTSAIMPVNAFGVQPAVSEFEELAKAYNLKLFFDSSQGLGSKSNGKYIGGNGDAEIFSLSATKVLPAGEGGILTTNDEQIYKSIKMGRHWGDPGSFYWENSYNPRDPGLNGHMTEFEAIFGIWGLKYLQARIDQRKQFVSIYKERLGNKVNYQKIPDSYETNYMYFAIIVPLEKHVQIMNNLELHEIQFKNYFYPCHMTDAYRKSVSLPITEECFYRVITLPIHNKLTESKINKICDCILEIL